MAQRRARWTATTTRMTLMLALAALALAGTTGTAAAAGVEGRNYAQDSENSMVRRYIQQREPAMVDTLAARGIVGAALGKRQSNDTVAEPSRSSDSQQSTAAPPAFPTSASTTAPTQPNSQTSAPNTVPNTQPQSSPGSNTAGNPGQSSSTAVSSATSSPPVSSQPESSATSASSIVSSPASESSAVSSTPSSSLPSSAAGVSTIIITTTQSDGSVITSQSISSAPASSQTAGTGSSGGTNTKAWAIPLGVIGGIIALVGILFVGYRCTQTRFSELDEDGGRAIRWPEILKRHEDETTVLNPLSTHRRDNAAGMGIDLDDGASVMDPSDYQSNFNEKHFAAAGLGLAAPAMGISRSASSAGSSTLGGGSATGVATGGGPYYAGHQQGYYDPYLGACGAPYPPPRTLSPAPPHNGGPYYDPALYQHQQPPLYPPMVQPRGASPIQGGMGSPHSGGPPSASGSPHMRSHSPGPHQGLAVTTTGPSMQRPISGHFDDMESLQSAQQRPLSPMQAGSQQYSPYQQQGPYRLSVANPGAQDD